jgi:hypothetical protein
MLFLIVVSVAKTVTINEILQKKRIIHRKKIGSWKNELCAKVFLGLTLSIRKVLRIFSKGM